MVPTPDENADVVVLRNRCPTHALVRQIGDRWSMLVLISLHDHGELRSADLRRSIEGISQKMLTVSVRALERGGFVARRVEPTVPVSVSYRLTEVGESLVEAIGPLRRWAEQRAYQGTSDRA